MNGRAAPLSGALGKGIPAMLPGDGAHQKEAKSSAFDAQNGAVRHAVETTEDEFELRLRNAEALIGNHATVQDGAVIGARTLVAAGATVPPNTTVAEEVVLLGAAAKRQLPLTDGARWWVANNPKAYQELARRHRDGVAPVD